MDLINDHDVKFMRRISPKGLFDTHLLNFRDTLGCLKAPEAVPPNANRKRPDQKPSPFEVDPEIRSLP